MRQSLCLATYARARNCQINKSQNSGRQFPRVRNAARLLVRLSSCSNPPFFEVNSIVSNATRQFETHTLRVRARSKNFQLGTWRQVSKIFPTKFSGHRSARRMLTSSCKPTMVIPGFRCLKGHRTVNPQWLFHVFDASKVIELPFLFGRPICQNEKKIVYRKKTVRRIKLID